MRAIILIASLSVLMLTGCVHNRGYAYWDSYDRPVYASNYNSSKDYKKRTKARKKAIKKIRKENKKHYEARAKTRRSDRNRYYRNRY